VHLLAEFGTKTAIHGCVTLNPCRLAPSVCRSA
jgi:hypothetical protein